MTREEAIQVLNTYDVNFYEYRANEIADAIYMAVEALSTEAVHKPDYSYEADMVRRLKESISSEAAQRWIPVTERLPKKNKEVLISLEWGVDIGEYRNGGWHSEWINHYDDDNVLAWMPLPEPYKGGDDK